ncbi:AAA family ATPase [Nocardia sp. alder85J]|nr:AAA family ATPase [Nocardia sp. alder85J]MCX4093016.1 AAA family ATPase [Nocardia sp. alder85J]
MSRPNDGLPMLPPWLSENDVTESGYEAPVQNLPHEEFIPEKPSSRRRFGRRSDSERPAPETEKKRGWGRRKDRAEAEPPEQQPWGQSEYEPDYNGGFRPEMPPDNLPPLPQRTGGEFQLPPGAPQTGGPGPGGFPMPPDGPGPRPDALSAPPTEHLRPPESGPWSTPPPAHQGFGSAPAETTERLSHRPDLPPSPAEQRPAFPGPPGIGNGPQLSGAPAPADRPELPPRLLPPTGEPTPHATSPGHRPDGWPSGQPGTEDPAAAHGAQPRPGGGTHGSGAPGTGINPPGGLDTPGPGFGTTDSNFTAPATGPNAPGGGFTTPGTGPNTSGAGFTTPGGGPNTPGGGFIAPGGSFEMPGTGPNAPVGSFDAFGTGPDALGADAPAANFAPDTHHSGDRSPVGPGPATTAAPGPQHAATPTRGDTSPGESPYAASPFGSVPRPELPDPPRPAEAGNPTADDLRLPGPNTPAPIGSAGAPVRPDLPEPPPASTSRVPDGGPAIGGSPSAAATFGRIPGASNIPAGPSANGPQAHDGGRTSSPAGAPRPADGSGDRPNLPGSSADPLRPAGGASNRPDLPSAPADPIRPAGGQSNRPDLPPSPTANPARPDLPPAPVDPARLPGGPSDPRTGENPAAATSPGPAASNFAPAQPWNSPAAGGPGNQPIGGESHSAAAAFGGGPATPNSSVPPSAQQPGDAGRPAHGGEPPFAPAAFGGGAAPAAFPFAAPGRTTPDGASSGDGRPATGEPGRPGGESPFPAGRPEYDPRTGETSSVPGTSDNGPTTAPPVNAPWTPAAAERPASGGRHRIIGDTPGAGEFNGLPPHMIGAGSGDPQFETTTRFTPEPAAEVPPSRFNAPPDPAMPPGPPYGADRYGNGGAAAGFGTASQAGQSYRAPDGTDVPYAQPNPTGPAGQYPNGPYPNPGPGGQWQQPGQPPQQQWGTTNYASPQPGGMQPSLDDVPVRRARKSPNTGWRRAVHHMSGGTINPGMSAEERRLQELVARIRQPVRGDYRIAVLSLKGGVGKTTTTMGIGSIFASIRGDRVIAVDANPDFGTLSQRVALQTRSTVRDLLLDPKIGAYSDVRRHTSQSTSRLEVLASERDPAASESFSDEEYRQVARILQRFYNIILTDCGTGLMHSAMAGVLDLAHSLVLISSSAIDGARSAAATLDWLSLHGHDHLVRNAVVVINLPRPGSPNVGIQQLREYFLSRCRAVHVIPFDPHLSEGAEIDLARLHKETKRSLVELSATVADDFATDHRRFHEF